MADTPLGAGLRLPDDVPLVRKLGHELIEFLPVGVYLCNAAGQQKGTSKRGQIYFFGVR